MMKQILVALLLWPLIASAALAQGASNCHVDASDPSYATGQTQPCSMDTSGRIRGNVTATIGVAGATTTEAKITIAVSNTYQQALAASGTRKGCTIQYVAVAGTKGFVFFGAAPGDTTTSFQLTNGQSLNCAIGGLAVATDAIQVTATATDIFIVSNQ